MDAEIARLIDSNTPKINPLVGHGIAVEHMKPECVEYYLTQIFKSAFKDTIPGLQFVGLRRRTPEERLQEITRIRGSKRTYDIARSDIYMVNVMFRYKGKELEPRPLNLPFVRSAGTLYLSASRFLISPVATDQVISIDFSNIFVRLLRDRVTFQRTLQHFMVNDEVDSAQVAWSFIHHGMRRTGVGRNAIKANSTLVHYLFCKYGFTETFRLFGGCVPEVGGPEINSNSHPPEDWVICSSSCLAKQMKPKGYPKGPYEPSQIRVAVRKSEFTPMVKNMIAGFFYVADHYPERVSPQWIDSKRLWYVLMGRILWNDEEHEGRLENDIANHMASLDSYLDEMIATKLRTARDIACTDIYQLFAIIIERFSEWLLSASDKVNSMYDKELNVLYYVLFPITNAIFGLAFKLEASSKNDLSEKELNTTMASFLKPGLIFDITNGHGEISTVNYSGDNKALKMTTMLIPQHATNKKNGKGGGQSMANDPTKMIHISVAEFGGYSNLPKSDPSGRGRINPMVHIDPVTNVMQRNPALIALMDATQAMLDS